MKNSSLPTREAAHPTVTAFLNLQTPDQAIQIGFTDQKVSGRAGLLTFAGFLHWHRLGALLARVLPHQRTSKKAIPVADLALGFLAGILAGAQKLTQVAHLRRAVLLPDLLAIRCVGSQASFTRFFQGFPSAGKNLSPFRPLWRWAMERLPSRKGGYSLDLDSPRLLPEDGHPEGVKTGYTRLGNKPCLHPLLAVLAETKLVVGFWLRAGNASCASNVVAFPLDLLANLPAPLRLRGVRADSGFCLAEWLNWLEQQKLRYIAVARLLKPLPRLLKKELRWPPSAVAGPDVAEVWHQEVNWAQPRRVILLRHRIAEQARPGGKPLLDCPGYLFQARVTNLPESVRPIEVWRAYNGRAGGEEVIKQLDADFARPKLCLKKFWSTAAAVSLAVLRYNLCVLLQRHLGWLDRVTAATLRYRICNTGGIISETGGRTTIRRAVRAAGERAGWRRLLEKLQSPVPNCNSVAAMWA